MIDTIRKIRKLLRYIKLLFWPANKTDFDYFGYDSGIEYPFFYAGSLKNIYIGNHVWINSFARINTYSGKLIIKDSCAIGQGLSVISYNHNFFSWDDIPESPQWRKIENCTPNTVTINEHCWIGANVTLLAGCNIGRGCLVAAGSICVNKEYPPYTILGGVPAKVIKFRLSLEDQIKHELNFFPEGKRIPEETLRINYKLYSNNE